MLPVTKPESALRIPSQEVDSAMLFVQDHSDILTEAGTDPDAEDGDKCELHPRLSVLSFLIALIGGGVFSLEAFEAFPML